MFAVATPTAAVAECSSAPKALMSGRCSTSFEGNDTGRSSGRRRLPRSSVGVAYWSGMAAQIDGKLIALLLQLFLQAWQGRDLGVAKRLLLQHVDLAYATKLEAPPRKVQRLGIGLDDVACGIDLRLQRRLSDRRVDHVGGQRQVGCLHLEALILRLGVKLLDLPSDAAKRIQGVGDVQRAAEDRERRRTAAEPKRRQ